MNFSTTKKWLLFASVALVTGLISGCRDRYENNDLKVEITNLSTHKMDVLKIYTMSFSKATDSIVFVNLEKGASTSRLWNNVKINTDGAFLVVSKNAQKTLSESFGYYTNGSLLDEAVSLKLYDDSIVVRTTPKVFY